MDCEHRIIDVGKHDEMAVICSSIDGLILNDAGNKWLKMCRVSIPEPKGLAAMARKQFLEILHRVLSRVIVRIGLFEQRHEFC